MSNLWILAIILAAVQFTAGCGKNVFKASEKKDPAEDATVYLEDGQPQKAIDLLTEALVDDPTNTKYMSILAMAYAQKAGVDPLTLAQKVGSGASSSSGSALTALFPYLPAATDANIADVDTAITWLGKIPSAQRIKADVFKMGIFQTSSMALRSKKLDTNGDGILSAAEILAMSGTDATAILANLAAAAAAFAGGNGSIDTTSAAAAAKIADIQTAINATSGSTTDEKLKNYLATH